MKIDKIQRNNSPKSDKIQGNNQKTMCKYCITDMIRAQEGGDMERTNVVIQNWMRLKDTIEFLGFWEQLSNPKFNCIEFEAIKASSKGSHIIPQPSAICKNCKKERARTRERRLIITNP